jgi:hypothetical protein
MRPRKSSVAKIFTDGPGVAQKRYCVDHCEEENERGPAKTGDQDASQAASGIGVFKDSRLLWSGLQGVS